MLESIAMAAIVVAAAVWLFRRLRSSARGDCCAACRQCGRHSCEKKTDLTASASEK